MSSEAQCPYFNATRSLFWICRRPGAAWHSQVVPAN